MNFKINEELANAVLQYLANRPYAEVVGLVQGLQNLEKLDAKEPAKTK